MISVSGGQSVDINFFKMFRSGLFERFFLKKKTGTRCYKRDKIWGNANSLLKWLFRSRCRRCCLSFLFLCVERKGWGGGGGVWWKGPGGAYLLSPCLGSLSSDIFERRMSTGSEPFFLQYALTLPNLLYCYVSFLLCVENHGSRVQKAYFRLTCVAQKRRWLKSLLCFCTPPRLLPVPPLYKY